MKLRYIKFILFFAGLTAVVSCKKYFDINKDPDRLPSSTLLYPQLLTSAQVALGFEGGSDLFRYTTLIMQLMSGQPSIPNQTYEYGRYNITGNDQNNLWSTMYATTLSDLELIIKQATAAGSPHYSGLAKVLKAFEYVRAVDTWGDIPYTEAQQQSLNKAPKYDDDEAIYNSLITIINEGINEMNATTSVLSPGTNSVIYTNATWATARALWIKFANTLKLRIYIHYSKKNPAFCAAQITSLVNSGATFMSSVADGFQMQFYSPAGQQSPITQFEVNRANYLFADRSMVESMLSRNDPRLPFYFTVFPFDFTPFTRSSSAASTATTLTFAYSNTIVTGMTVSGTGIPPYTIVKTVVHTPATSPTTTTITLDDFETAGFAIGAGASGTTYTFSPAYRGASTTKPPVGNNPNYSRVHTFLRGPVTAGTAAPAPYTGTVAPFTYSGQVMQRLLPYAEYCFIRAEAALMGAPGSAQTFFTDGITAALTEVGVSSANITAYLAANGTLSGTSAQQLRRIIEEKYLALNGVSVEPWTDWRRTGYPVLSPAANGFIPSIPRSFFYPQSEIDFNPNCPGQKAADLQTRVFWDN